MSSSSLISPCLDQLADLALWEAELTSDPASVESALVSRLSTVPDRRAERGLRHPLIAILGRCELCEERASVEVHQIRKLADLAASRRPQPAWAQHMAKTRRKTLVVCITCHQAIHARQPAAVSTEVG